MDYLSIDIGGTMIKTAIIDRSGQIFEKEEFPTPKDSLEELKCLLVRKIEKVQYQIKGIAICVPGKVNNRIGKILVGGSLHYLNGFEMSDFIKTKFDIPVSVENDAKAAALAELWRGTLKNKSNGILLVLGTAVGGAILYDGKIMRGSTFQAGELSYQLTEKNHALNYQGRNLSAVRMIEEIGNILDLENPDDGVAVFKYLNNHDSRVLPVFKNYCKRLAILINNLQVTIA